MPFFADDRMEDEAAYLGDPRRCEFHGEIISSPCGMYDGVCGACEYGDDEAAAAAEEFYRLGYAAMVSMAGYAGTFAEYVAAGNKAFEEERVAHLVAARAAALEASLAAVADGDIPF